MINKETIISVFDDKLTLMQWLKKVEEALNGAVLTGVELKKKGNATFAWSFDFEDGTHVDTDYVTINEGESVAEAYLLNGHLMIKLTNDEIIDAGNLKPVTSFSFNSQRHLIVSYGDGTTQDLGLIKGVSSFTIDTNQHLIVNYDNGTTQDLGAIFSGDININGNLSCVDLNATGNVTGNSIIENMSGYSFLPNSSIDETIYAGVVKNGNKITFCLFVRFTADGSAKPVGTFNIPSAIGAKIYPTQYGTDTNWVDTKQITASVSASQGTSFVARMYKNSNTQFIVNFRTDQLTSGTQYVARYEVTFLLSPNLAGN